MLDDDISSPGRGRIKSNIVYLSEAVPVIISRFYHIFQNRHIGQLSILINLSTKRMIETSKLNQRPILCTFYVNRELGIVPRLSCYRSIFKNHYEVPEMLE